MSMLLVVLVGLVGGLAGALQTQFLGIMEVKAGTLASTFVTYGGGGLAVGLLMLAMRGARLSDLREVPWWAFTSGLMGLVVVASLGITVSRLGLGSGLTLFTGATLILAAVIDHFGLFTEASVLDARRLAGVAFVIFGTWLVVGSSA
ncbi:MAG: DMT family transporter [Acidimicrobiia bacterium]